MRTLIIEDEPLTAQRLRQMLHRYDPGIVVLDVIPSAAGAVDWLKHHPDPDLVFMDIHLEDESCFTIFERLNLDVPVIFTTAYDEYMVKAFKVNSIDYLMKPVNYEELVHALEKYKRLRQPGYPDGLTRLLEAMQQKEPEYKSRFLITGTSKLYSIEVDKIRYFYFSDKLTLLVTADNQHLPVEYSLDKLAALLDPKLFFRINRQMIVKLAAIEKMHVYSKGRIKLDLVPASKKEVLVSLDRITAFKEWLGK